MARSGFDASEFRPGGEAAVAWHPRGAGTRYEIWKVASVTPTGQVVLEDGWRFVRGRGTRHGLACELVPLTREVRESIERADLLVKLRDVDRWVETLPLGALREVAALYDAHPQR